MTEIKNEQLEVLGNVLHILNNMNDDQYAMSSSMLSPNSLGKHFRHIADFYNNFINGIEKSEINYDKRERKELFEVNRLIMIKEIVKIKNYISEISMNTSLNIFSMTTENRVIKTESNTERELLFLQSHTLHHLAIIVIVLNNEFDMNIDYSLATSASTLLNS